MAFIARVEVTDCGRRGRTEWEYSTVPPLHYGIEKNRVALGKLTFRVVWGRCRRCWWINLKSDQVCWDNLLGVELVVGAVAGVGIQHFHHLWQWHVCRLCLHPRLLPSRLRVQLPKSLSRRKKKDRRRKTRTHSPGSSTPLAIIWNECKIRRNIKQLILQVTPSYSVYRIRKRKKMKIVSKVLMDVVVDGGERAGFKRGTGKLHYISICIYICIWIGVHERGG